MAAPPPTGAGAWLAAALLALAMGIAAWALLRPFDAAVADWARRHAPSAASTLLPALDHGCRFGLLALVIAAAAARSDWPRALAGAAAVIALANLAAEVLKTAIERARPSAAVLAAGGNSLPSGHVLGSTVTALVAIALLRRAPWPRGLRAALAAAALAAVAGESLARILRGSHWASDVGFSLWLAIAWVLGARAVAPFGARAAGVSLASLVAAYAVFHLCPGLRLSISAP